MKNDKEDICKHTGKPFNCGRCEGAKEIEIKGSRLMHCHMSVSGPLSRDSKKNWRSMSKYITRDDGESYTPQELRAEFLRMNSLGWETIPMDSNCDNHCYKKGCLGHKSEDKKTE